ncbi:MAG: hypothetical protein F7C07_00260 [Desulfurococcales archaeon]|nr:hypothetical protein [Desulfurococcales archaeon]
MVMIRKVEEGKYMAEIEGEDHTIGNILAEKLREHSMVGLAYYEEPHPLENRIIVFFTLKEPSADPRKVLIEALENALSDVEALRKAYLSALKEKGLGVEDLEG